MSKSATPAPGQHRATYARDRQKGGYMVRVEGPFANKFGSQPVEPGSKVMKYRTVPVTRKNGELSEEQLDTLVWTGTDEETGRLIALYTMVERDKKQEQAEIPF